MKIFKIVLILNFLFIFNSCKINQRLSNNIEGKYFKNKDKDGLKIILKDDTFLIIDSGGDHYGWYTEISKGKYTEVNNNLLSLNSYKSLDITNKLFHSFSYNVGDLYHKDSVYIDIIPSIDRNLSYFYNSLESNNISYSLSRIEKKIKIKFKNNNKLKDSFVFSLSARAINYNYLGISVYRGVPEYEFSIYQEDYNKYNHFIFDLTNFNSELLFKAFFKEEYIYRNKNILIWEGNKYYKKMIN